MISLERILQNEDLFDLLNKEDIQESRQITIKTNPSIEKLCRACEYYLQKIKPTWISTGYSEADKEVDSSYSSADITSLSLLLKRYEDLEEFKWVGSFISVLINRSKDRIFILLTSHLKKEINFIGSGNTKKIIVKGNVGDDAGYSMRSGLLHIYGSTRNILGNSLFEGRIIVEGDVGNSLGYKMKRGIIEIKGDAGEAIGEDMEGGEIFLHKNYKAIYGWPNLPDPNTIHNLLGHRPHGTIYHKRKPIIFRGRRI